MNYIKDNLDDRFVFELVEFKLPLLKGNNNKSSCNKPNIKWKKECLHQIERINKRDYNSIGIHIFCVYHIISINICWIANRWVCIL